MSRSRFLDGLAVILGACLGFLWLAFWLGCVVIIEHRPETKTPPTERRGP